MVEKNQLRLSSYVTVSPLSTEEGGIAMRLLMALRTGEVLQIPDSSWKSLTSGELESLSDELVHKLVVAEILVPNHIDELGRVLSENQDSIATSRLLYQVIQPTASCQMGCEYCGQQHSKRLLSAQDQKKIVERIRSKLKLGRYRKLEVGWFGGEPLLAIDVIRKLSPQLAQAAEDSCCDYTSKMVTNGLLLTSEIADELYYVHHVRSIEVTIDGLPPRHNQQRPLKKGGATFDKIFSNILAVAGRKFKHFTFKIRCNVTRQSAEDIPELISFLSRHELQGKVLIYFAPVHAWGNEAHLTGLSIQDFAVLEMKWLAQLLQEGFEIPMLPRRKTIVCLAVQPEAEVIDAFGELHACSETPYVPGYNGNYSLGTLESPLEIPGALAQRLRGFNQEMREKSYGCATCFLLPVCGGQCPKQWIENSPPCPSLKYNLPERLILSYAQSKQKI